MNEKDLALFKMKAIRSKKELIKAVNNYLVRAERSSLPAMDQTVESLELVREFKTRIEESPLPFFGKAILRLRSLNCRYRDIVGDSRV